MPWTADHIPDLSGRTAVVTGANSGLGLETARELARHGATVVLACRNQETGRRAQEEVGREATAAPPELARLDLGSLAGVRELAGSLADREIHVLVNNAGLMAVPFSRTADGFEVQMGTNHLGHFALTGLLLPTLVATPGSRVVTLSSEASYLGRPGRLDRGSYTRLGVKRWQVYADSKLANVTFALELDRRLRAAGTGALSVAAHPGYAATGLQTRQRGVVEDLGMRLLNVVVAQSAGMGALPTLYAATAPGVEGGRFYGPDGFRALRGYPTSVPPPRPARDPEVGRRLWEESARMTGVDPAL